MRILTADDNLMNTGRVIGNHCEMGKDIAVCPLCNKYITDVKVRKGSVISFKCPRCKSIVDIIL